ncbi:MAG TPA: glycoside hydrolase family 28 protein [Opitutaceae bacterium]|nr:glycoside hydrolase family 28 protein [Opitutaceae bacterium]
MPRLPRALLLAALLLGASRLRAAGVFNLLDFGARNDGSAPATAAFHAAIRAAQAAGGGTVRVPAGTYTTGPIELVSNLVLELDAGAVVRFPAQRLPFTEGREQGIECLTPVPLIGGRGLENVTIAGRGVLTTDNAAWLRLMSRTKAAGGDPGTAFGPNWERLLASLERHTPATRAEYLAAAPELRPSFVRFMDCRNVLISGVHFVGSSMWTIHLLYTDNAVVRDVIIETYPGVHTDGIGVDSSRNVRISGCYIDTGDDGIVLKSGKDADGRRVNRPTENVSIDNCTVHHAHGAVTIGSETAGGIRNVVAADITCDGTQEGVRIKSRRGRGGVVEDLRFSNWTLRNVGVGIDVTNFYLMEGETRAAPEPVSARTPVFREIAISHLTIDGAKTAIEIQGLPEMPIFGLRISDVIAAAESGLRASHADALELRQVQINPRAGPAFALRDCLDPELAAVSARRPAPGAAVIRLEDCPGALVRDCRAFAGTGTFLSLAAGGARDTALVGNVLEAAGRPVAEDPPR